MRGRVTVTSSGGDLAAELADVTRRVEALPFELAGSIEDTGRQVIGQAVQARRGTASVGELGTLDIRSTSSAGVGHATVELVATGPWGLVDGGAVPHPITTRKRGMPTPYGVKANVNHPGTDGLNIWDDAGNTLDSQIGEDIQRTADAALGG